jgi:hypothetical protein
MGASIIIEFHGWRGLTLAGGPFGRVLVLGFTSLTWVPFLLSEWIATRALKLKNVLKGSGFPEMSAFGEDK